MPTFRLLPFLAPEPPAPPLPAEKVDAEYRRLRRQVFAGIFIGYAAFYLVRKNLALAMPDILSAGREGMIPAYTEAQLGMGLTALSFAYGLSKFVMGSVSDRSNPRYFLPLGLLLSAGVTAVFGCVKGVYGSLALIVALSALNGWVNGMGWPPCGKTMTHWFGARERGRVVSVWNVAHNVGGALVAKIALLGVLLFHDWGAAFYFNAMVAAGCAGVAWLLMRDTPQSRGLPAIERWRNDYPSGYSEAHERVFSFREIFLGHVLPNRALWCIALANAFVYFVRYGVVDWVPTYLQLAKGFSPRQSSTAWMLFELAAIPGTILCGWVSDTVFKSRRAPATILFMGLTLAGILLYWLNMSGPAWVDYAALFTAGFFIYGPVMLIGLHALELVPKKAAGTAAGFTGFFGYAFGSAAAGTGVGWIAGHFHWSGVFAAMTACCLLTMLFSALAIPRGAARERA
ncbi:MAG: phosphoglycerate transporter protein PgtP [Opitutaceae bacterium]|jgi:OPA family glycerol-3-phosphate transporter-like MFS transporter|nr:phosphoglycerate transporter protein PgtP [Opitutaceae bacterium]